MNYEGDPLIERTQSYWWGGNSFCSLFRIVEGTFGPAANEWPGPRAA